MLLKRLFYSITALIFLLNSGCSSVQHAADAGRPAKLSNLRYGKHPRHRMDVYLPANRSDKTPFVLLIHGGAWVTGDKLLMMAYQKRLLKAGIASASITHRFASRKEVHYRQILDDIDLAFDFCAARAGAWHTRKDHFIMSGHSSGGHLSLLYSYTTTRRAIDAVIALSPPSDLTDTLFLNSSKKKMAVYPIERITGADYTPGQALDSNYTLCSPVYTIKNIPTLIIHGTADWIVPHRQSVKLYTRLKEQGVPAKLMSIEGERHMLILKGRKTIDQMYREAIGWIRKYAT